VELERFDTSTLADPLLPVKLLPLGSAAFTVCAPAAFGV
jgi:hypothetical protein